MKAGGGPWQSPDRAARRPFACRAWNAASATTIAGGHRGRAPGPSGRPPHGRYGCRTPWLRPDAAPVPRRPGTAAGRDRARPDGGDRTASRRTPSPGSLGPDRRAHGCGRPRTRSHRSATVWPHTGRRCGTASRDRGIRSSRPRPRARPAGLPTGGRRGAGRCRAGHRPDPTGSGPAAPARPAACSVPAGRASAPRPLRQSTSSPSESPFRKAWGRAGCGFRRGWGSQLPS